MTRDDDKTAYTNSKNIDPQANKSNKPTIIDNEHKPELSKATAQTLAVDKILPNKPPTNSFAPTASNAQLTTATSQIKRTSNASEENNTTVIISKQITATPVGSSKAVTSVKSNSKHNGDTTMQDNILNAFNEQAKAMYAPMAKFNSLLVESMEKMTEFQLRSIKSYAEIGFGQMKQAANIQDAEGMRQFSVVQTEATSTLNKKILEDAKAMTDMAAEFRNKIEDVMAQTRQSAEKATAASAKKAG
jgi:phasin family protein